MLSSMHSILAKAKSPKKRLFNFIDAFINYYFEEFFGLKSHAAVSKLRELQINSID